MKIALRLIVFTCALTAIGPAPFPPPRPDGTGGIPTSPNISAQNR